MRTDPEADASLARPVAVTLLGVGAVDLAAATAVGLLAAPWLAPVGAALGLGVPLWPLVVAPAAGAIAWGQLRVARRGALASAGARRVSERERPDLYARLGRVARAADRPVPSLAVVPTSTPNSFAVGGPDGGTVVVSEGLVELLDDDALDAVLAHELAHLSNRDGTAMTLAAALPTLLSDGYSPLSALPGESGGPVRTVVLGVVLTVVYLLGAAALGLPALSVAGVVGVVAMAALTLLLGGALLGALAAPSLLLSRRLSRYREFSADRAAARTVGDPAAMARALRDVETAASGPDAAPPVTGNAGVRGLCLLPHGFDADPDADTDPGGDGAAGDGEASGGYHVQIRSHPPTEERIARLRELAAERAGRDAPPVPREREFGGERETVREV